ncbi:MAG: hypothetical protein KGZ30_02195, partial [Anaplasmataceae bacterium]|nr:hypothetical protein [Anaplasmataceae bacterium]
VNLSTAFTQLKYEIIYCVWYYSQGELNFRNIACEHQKMLDILDGKVIVLYIFIGKKPHSHYTPPNHLIGNGTEAQCQAKF